MGDSVPSLPTQPESLDEQGARRRIRRRRRSTRPGRWPAGNMPQAQVALYAAAPRAYEGEIQRSADHRTGQGNQAPNPFFRGFLSKLNGQPFCDARRKSFKDLLLGKILAVVNTGGRGRSHPQLEPFALAPLLESV